MTEHCLVKENCCETITKANRNCYRAQCFATTKHLTAALGLSPSTFSITFQSRLGRTPWIKPYTDDKITELAGSGVKKIVVFCPAFVADCLETIEEIGIRAVEQFKGLGGESLTLVPSLNATDPWASAVSEYAKARSGDHAMTTPLSRPRQRARDLLSCPSHRLPLRSTKRAPTTRARSPTLAYSPRRAFDEWTEICNTILHCGGDAIFRFESADDPYPWSKPPFRKWRWRRFPRRTAKRFSATSKT